MDNNLPVNPSSTQSTTNPPTINTFGQSEKRNSKRKIVFTILIVLLLITTTAIGTYLVQQRQNVKSKASSDIVAQVGNQQITTSQLDQAKLLFSDILVKPPTDPEVNQASLNFLVENILLKKYATEQGILDESNKIAEERYQNSLQSAGIDQSTFALANKNKEIYKDYLLDQAIKEKLQQTAIKWKDISFLSTRYNFDDNAIAQEKDYKDTVDKKILEYQKNITDKESLENAIKQRCQDPAINYLPYNQKNKIYTTTFNGKICREQAVNLKVSTTTNPMFGEKWLEKIFANTKKGEVSQIIDFTDKNLGMYFIVYENDEGGEYMSMNDLINSLKTSAGVQIFQSP